MPMAICTMTGASDSNDLSSLFRLSDAFPFVEWGVLYSESQAGQGGRYPSFDWITRFIEQKQAASVPAKSALHVCGGAVRDLIEGKGRVIEIADHFDRIQVNFRSPDFDIEAIRAMIRSRPKQTIITQHNEANFHLWAFLYGVPNHAVLFDTSGGRGVECAEWLNPLPGKRCGYAGGLGPDNVFSELPKILEAADGEEFWIDMEGKLRDADDQFDLDRVKKVLTDVARIDIRRLRPLSPPQDRPTA